MKAPLLTVVIANYNYGVFLESAILSVLQQCEAPIKDDSGRALLPIKGSDDTVELIICDAASNDNSRDVIDKYANSLAWWCSEKDGGQSEAFNKGFSNGHGKFLTWLNADEEYLPGTFLALSRKVRSKPSALWISGNMLVFDFASRNINRVTWGPHFQPWFLKKNRACIDVFGPSSFVRHDVYEKIGPINENFHYSMDLEYWARLNMAGIRQTRLNHICWAFATHSTSKSQGAMTPEQIKKGHAENVARETVLGYKYKTSFKNPWYCLWMACRILDGSLLVRYFKRRKLIGTKFAGCMKAECQEREIPLLYKDRREEGDTPLRQCQLVALHLLHVLDRVCRENDIPYFLVGGTLLGAMRHDGFIPWDDDIDVGMRTKDFKKFLKVAPHCLPEDVYLQSPGDVPSSGYRFAKIRDAYSFYYEPHSRVPTIEPSGICLDIFPYEDCPLIPDRMRRSIGWLASAFYEHRLDNFKKMVDRSIWLGPFYYVKAVSCAIAHCLLRLLWKGLLIILPSPNVTHLLEFWERNLHFPKSWIGVMPRHKFEDGEFPVPNHPKEILSQQYGEWEKLPPPENRRSHMSFVDAFHAGPHKFAKEYPR